MLDTSKNITLAAVAFVLIIGSYTLGYSRGTDMSSVQAASANILHKKPSFSSEQSVDFDPFWKAWAVLEEKYVPSSTSTNMLVTDQEKVWGAIEGLARSLGDPYTVFLPPQESKAFEEDISGNFGGVGMEMTMRDGVLTVIAPLKGMPAERAGIRAGDKVIGIDGEGTGQMTVDDAVSKIRGEEGTSVSLTIIRDDQGEPLEVTIVRAIIDIPTIATEYAGEHDEVFVIELYNFAGISANLFRNALREYIISGRKNLIIDLRGNPGGYLEAAVDMTSWFLPQGTVVVTEDAAGKGENKVYRSKGYNVLGKDHDIVVLVDQGSASASEIFAGALQDHGRAQLVGRPTFGKGSVQELVHITPDTSLKVTIARWLTPNGISISAGGLVPDFEIEMTAEDAEAGRDPQRDKAIEVLLGM